MSETKKENQKLADIGLDLYNRGLEAFESGQYKTAAAKLSESLEICESLVAVEGIYRVSRSLGAVFTTMGEHQKAMEAYLRAFDVSKTTSAPTINALDSVYSVGESLTALEQNEKAINLWRSGISLFLRLPKKDKEENIEVLRLLILGIAGAYTLLDEMDKAETYMTLARKIAEDPTALAAVLTSFDT